MGKPRSTETALRLLKADYRKLQRRHALLTLEERASAQRAANAEAEVAEWKKRFDTLLHRDGEKK